ncbi:MAG: hypothetical protein RR307_05715 [Clostridia bacterium]
MSKMEQKGVRRVALLGERSGHLTKLVNELGSWKFFKYLYANDMLKILAVNFIMLLISVPVLYFIISNTALETWRLSSNYPDAGSFLIGDNVWFGLSAFTANVNKNNLLNTSLWIALAFCVSPLIFSGGFAVIRDAFWIGSIKVIKPYFKGIAQSALIMLPFMIVLGGLFYLINLLYAFMMTVMAPWLAITLIVIVWIIYVAMAMFVMMLYSVVAVHKQPLRESVLDTWELYITNILPNIFSFVLAFAPPVALCFMGMAILTNFIGSLLFMMFVMFGFFYVVFVWQTHMMKTFRLYHPVEKKRVNK